VQVQWALVALNCETLVAPSCHTAV